MSQCLGLTLLSSVIATLTLDATRDVAAAAAAGIGIAANGAASVIGSGNRVRGRVFAEDAHMRELQGSQVGVEMCKTGGGGGVSFLSCSSTDNCKGYRISHF